MRPFYCFLITLLLTACAPYSNKKQTTLPPANAAHPLTVLAFGSCNSQERDQPLWLPILKNKPQLWVWLGDNIYGDTDDMQVMAAKYQKQLAEPNYRKLMATTPMIGTWDDHDFGHDNAGKEYPQKAESQRLFWDFMQEPQDSPLRQQDGVYNAHTYGPPGRQVKIILLDSRTHRDSLLRQNGRYVPNFNGDLLGETQWQWLEQELKNSSAQFNIIGNGIQVIQEESGGEKWANFPTARKRIFDLIARTQARGVILLSGDRHVAELAKITWPGISYPVYDLTSSGLTHSLGGGLKEGMPNRYRVGKVHDKLNFGLLRFDWGPEKKTVSLEIKGRHNKSHQLVKVEYLTAASGINPKPSSGTE
ncbi:alkaline phosphatase D family protein [Adhaeribacter pallidiroseus]|uniref:Alkaline phosphatase n=1 Tax=Adhaeribacter pallidiroseus TaxID=2072847 RepID=A0A369QGP9_9BACT|nr:alkaline phosphatase D family protein [Adhaeribacter pallidiroseus]RDC62069.1 Alkaline phosphatase [Adhaeribacter pallidiroseus]